MNVTNNQPSNKVPVSILIPIKNEAANLPRCLESIKWADEIYVVDSNSQDGSIQIAESYGAHVVQFNFNGIWPKKKNWSLENLPFRNQWVFILDADEVLPPECEDEFRQIVTAPLDPATDITGYWINRRCMFMGKWLKHAYYPNWNLRLFVHSLGRYEQLIDQATASGDNEVHEHLIVKGKTGHLRYEMDHYAFPTVEVFVEKHNRYSNWEARFTLDHKNHKDSVNNLDEAHVRQKRKLKMLVQSMPCRPLMRFLYVYIWQLGFLDGLEGYYFARLHGFYEFLTVAKIHEIKRQVK